MVCPQQGGVSTKVVVCLQQGGVSATRWCVHNMVVRFTQGGVYTTHSMSRMTTRVLHTHVQGAMGCPRFHGGPGYHGVSRVPWRVPGTMGCPGYHGESRVPRGVQGAKRSPGYPGVSRVPWGVHVEAPPPRRTYPNEAAHTFLERGIFCKRLHFVFGRTRMTNHAL
jgi:hypothetical protein